MLKGRIININSTKYIVDVDGTNYDCILRGIFRKEGITPFVGDYVELNELNHQIMKIDNRINYLNRPKIANVDYAVIISSVKKPDLDLYLLDKLMVNILVNKIKPIIVFTKLDLLNEDELKDIEYIIDYYKSINIPVFLNSEISEFEKFVNNKVLVLCGQTGSGKSTFINKIDKSLNLETNEISNALNRGKHTTRYVSLYKIKDYYIADTPGFSSLDLNNISIDDIKKSFVEFKNYNCKYQDCNHINTDGCEIAKHIDKDILQSRYDSYCKIVRELNENSGKFFKK